MNYIEFVNYVKSKNIILFDHDYRIAYYNINRFLPKNLNMTGGGENTSYIQLLINLSLSQNPQYLLNLTTN